MGLNDRLKKLEKQHIVSEYAPVLIFTPEEIETNRKFIGPNTCVIIDDLMGPDTKVIINDIPRSGVRMEGLTNGLQF